MLSPGLLAGIVSIQPDGQASVSKGLWLCGFHVQGMGPLLASRENG